MEEGFPTFSATMEMSFHSGIMKATIMHELLHTLMAVITMLGCVGDMQHWLISAYHYGILGFRTCQQVFLKEKE